MWGWEAGGGGGQGWYTTCCCNFSPVGSSKSHVSDKDYVFDIVTTQNYHPIYAKQGLGRIYVFFTRFGYEVCGREGGGGAPKRLIHNLVMQFFNLGTSKMQFSYKAYFSDTVTTKNDHPIYVKHVLGRIICSLPYLRIKCGGGRRGGGGGKGGTQPVYATFHPSAAQKAKCPTKIMFLIL